ncbi:MAG TPA: flagellar hook-associated protein FlgK [Stellaceae bacterium]|jgi:flagellar hook-associated protein 1 FlgK|nr:flagellar hook-associated protein FlgK [Stellaceae bacterium]
MSGISELLNAGISGLQAALESMQAVSNNTANVSTPGYNLESVNQSEIPSIAGMPGLGATVTSIQRAFNQFVYQQVVAAGSTNQAAQTNQTAAQTLSALFPVASGGATGLGSSLSSFFSATNAVAQDPTSEPNREVMLTDAQSLASAFNSLGTQLDSNLTELDGEMGSAVSQINALSQQIAACNAQIAVQTNSPSGAPNSLLDERDNLVQQLGQQVGVTVHPTANGGVDVYTSGGAALVAGSASYQLSATQDGYGDGSVNVIYGPTGQNITASLSGGTIGGLVNARSQIVGAQGSVGALAVSLADAVNTQQSLGLDLNGNLGRTLFSVGGPGVLPSLSNKGSASLSASITDTNAFTAGDFIITKEAGGFAAVNTTTGESAALGSGPTLSLDGMTITVSGSAGNGDSFLLQPTAEGARSFAVTTIDPTKIAAASAYVATPGNNLGDVTATVTGGAAAASLPAGTPVIPAARFGQNLSIQFTSATTYNVLSSSNAVLASGSFSAATGGEVAIGYPSPPAPSGAVVGVALSAGTAAAGDTFALTPGGIGSNGNIVAMAGLAQQNLLSGQTLSSAYSSLVGTIGTYGQGAAVAAQAAQGVLNQAQTVQQSISGVNLDQQAANLVSYEQAYQASATVIGTAQTLFTALLTAVAA